MKSKRTIIAVGILAISASALAQQEEQPFPEEARRRLDYSIGKWRSKTQYLDEKGSVTRTVHSEDQREFVIDDRVVEISGVVKGDGRAFRAWEYYDVQEGKYTLTSIDRNGRLWTMNGDLGEKFIWTSDSREMTDGTTTALRFTHYDFSENGFTASGEVSKDGGRSWREFSRQFLTRISE